MQPDLEPHYRMVRPERLAALPRAPLHIVLDNIRSAYNTGSMFRTADAVAAAHMHLCGMTAYPPSVKLAKTALGAFDYVPWTHYPRTMDAVAALRRDKIPIIAVEVSPSAVSHTEFVWPEPVAVVLGNEVTGVSSDVMEAADAVVCISMNGYKNTINVATACGVILFEIVRQWAAALVSAPGIIRD